MLCLALFALAQAPANDADTTAVVGDESLLALDADLVTSASRANDPLRKAPASVTLIKRSEMDAFADTTIDDALEGTRGVFVTNDRTYPEVGLRGFSPFGTYGNRVQVQLDGHVMNGDWIGESYVSFDALSDLDMIDRVEVVRGPGSVLHGTGAVHGVIGLVLPDELDHAARVSASYVGWRTVRAHADAGGKVAGGPEGWVAVGAVDGAPEDLQMPSYAGTPWAPDGTAKGVGAFDGGTVLGHAKWGDFTGVAYGNVHRENLEAANFGTAIGDVRAHTDDQRGFAELRYDPTLLPGVELHARVAADYSGYQGTYPYADLEAGKGQEYYAGGWVTAEARTVLTLVDGLRLTVGALGQTHPWNIAHGEFPLPTPAAYIDESHSFHVGSLYANADWDLFDWLRLTGGARLDGWYYEELGVKEAPTGPRGYGAFSPRLAAIWMPGDDDTVKLMAGSAFRAPSTFELTYNDGGFTQIRNPGLQPETVYTAELEYTRRLPANCEVVLSTYGNDLVGLIDERGDATEEDPLRLVNSDTPAVTVGAEIEVRHELADTLFASVQYSFQRTRLGDLVGGDQIPNSPEHLAGVKVFTTALGKAAVLSTRVAAEYGRLDRDLLQTEPVVLVDATLSGDVEQLLRMHYAVGVRNLLDWQYTHPVGGSIQESRLPQDGRTLYLQLGFSL